MKKRITAIILLAALAASLLAACSSQKGKEPPQGGTGTYADYIDSGARIATIMGDIYGAMATDLFKAKEAREYGNIADVLENLRMDRVDAALTDSSYVKPLMESGSYPEFDFLWVPKEVFVNESASVFYSQELRDQYNEWLSGIEADGTLDEITGRWVGAPLPNDEEVPRFELTGENGTLRVCDTGDYPPFTYYNANGEYTGFNYEMMSRFAQHLGMNLEIIMAKYDAVLPTVISGRADMSACIYTITDERGKGVLFGNPCVVSQAVLVILKPGGDAPAQRAVRNHTDFAGKDIAVMTGVLTVNTTEKIGGKPIEYNDSASAAEDVRKGRVSGYMHALTAVQVMASQMEVLK